jgi:hypothetical protein
MTEINYNDDDILFEYMMAMNDKKQEPIKPINIDIREGMQIDADTGIVLGYETSYNHFELIQHMRIIHKMKYDEMKYFRKTINDNNIYEPYLRKFKIQEREQLKPTERRKNIKTQYFKRCIDQFINNISDNNNLNDKKYLIYCDYFNLVWFNKKTSYEIEYNKRALYDKEILNTLRESINFRKFENVKCKVFKCNSI